ncbi:MAG: type secretion system protein [Phycisphaerales bacterium]|nr:type secretion system protein [Phycisphaerales bacterium]
MSRVPRQLRSDRTAFTLVEMLAVIGIIVLLVGILLPTVMSARRNAERNAVRMELQTIALALEAYKADFGDYPRPPTGTPTQRKYRLLAWALIGPYDATTGVADPLAPGNTMIDGADGPGFRTVFDKSANKGGKVWGPYLAPDKFRVATSANNLDFPTTPADLRWDILDRYGSPIEYFPRWRNYQAGSNLFGLAAGSAATAVYDFQQQFMQVATSTPASGSGPMNYLRKALGDDDLNDVINAQETIQETPPFLLLSRGPLRSFSTDPDIKTKFAKTEEITNLQH